MWQEDNEAKDDAMSMLDKVLCKVQIAMKAVS